MSLNVASTLKSLLNSAKCSDLESDGICTCDAAHNKIIFAISKVLNSWRNRAKFCMSKNDSINPGSLGKIELYRSIVTQGSAGDTESAGNAWNLSSW